MKYLFTTFLHVLILQYGFSQKINVSKKSYNSPAQNLTIARSLVEINQEDSALYFLNLFLAQKFYHHEALLLRARIYANKNNLEKALIDYNSICTNWPSKEAFYFRGTIRHQLSQFDLAINDLNKALTMPIPETQIALFKIGQGGDGVTGITTMNDIDADIWNIIGLCKFEMNNYKIAVQSFSQGISIIDNYPELLINRARAYEKLGNTKGAILDYKMVIIKNPNNQIAIYNLSKLQNNHATGNLEFLNKFISAYPSMGEGYAERGMYYYETQKFTSAILDYKMALKLQPGKIDYLFNLALAYERNDNSREAEKYLLIVTEIKPNHIEANFNLGNLHFKNKQYEDAISNYTLALHTDSINAKILYNRALAYHKLKMHTEACMDMAEVKRIDNSLSKKYLTKYCTDN